MTELAPLTDKRPARISAAFTPFNKRRCRISATAVMRILTLNEAAEHYELTLKLSLSHRFIFLYCIIDIYIE